MLKYQLQDTSVFSKQTQSVLKFPHLFHVCGSDSCYPLISEYAQLQQTGELPLRFVILNLSVILT